ncbi:hypothetical protein BDV93DRAFT_549600 [Ceratobasidium sp. AG-I]|nr:hypothetical protein BDV93DRAFT_549600 [Ceratobasidium sp. AG-I]
MIQHSPPGSLNALSLTSRNEHVGGDTLDTDIDHLLASCSESMLESAEQLLSSVQYLTLSYAYFPWDSAAYHGLVELRLDLSEDVGSFDWPPSQDEIATILSSSPMLRTLSLKVDYLWDIHDSSIEPICLKHLERFTLELSNRHRCLGLLPLVSPGPNPLSVRVSFHSSPAFWEELWALAQRSEITSLHVVAEASNSWAVPLSRHLAQLESLTLVGFKINQKALSDFLLSTSNNIKTSAWPRLHTLRLMNCRIDEESLMGLLASLQIRKVRMYRMCSTHPVPGSRIGRASPDIATMVELEQRISLVIPDTKYYPFGDLD